MRGKKINDITPEEWDSVGKSSPHYPAEYDPVEKPEHYNKGNIEAIDYIKQQLGINFEDYCYGVVIKYLHRFRYKDGVQDLRKAKWYLEQMIEDMADTGK